MILVERLLRSFMLLSSLFSVAVLTSANGTVIDGEHAKCRKKC